ncbi:hypothetical protein EfmAA96_19140 [Enterococcus faecium]|nr:hypothetical protein EfmAA96_19140 [Enterococcus faecium]
MTDLDSTELVDKLSYKVQMEPLNGEETQVMDRIIPLQLLTRFRKA